MGLPATGRLHKIFETEQKTERFRLREFIVELVDNPQYPQYVKFQLTGNRCENLDAFQVGQEVNVEFSLRGREWTNPDGEIRYFNSLDVWTLQPVAGASIDAPIGDEPPPPGDDDIPF
ncbi:MAG: DUF3127 domain-containing protein [Myxococcota bacterium]